MVSLVEGMKQHAARRREKAFKPGGQKGKLHREMGIKEGTKIPADRLAAAASKSNTNVEERNDAIRAETMKKWKK